MGKTPKMAKPQNRHVWCFGVYPANAHVFSYAKQGCFRICTNGGVSGDTKTPHPQNHKNTKNTKNTKMGKTPKMAKPQNRHMCANTCVRVKPPPPKHPCVFIGKSGVFCICICRGVSPQHPKTPKHQKHRKHQNGQFQQKHQKWQKHQNGQNGQNPKMVKSDIRGCQKAMA